MLDKKTLFRVLFLEVYMVGMEGFASSATNCETVCSFSRAFGDCSYSSQSIFSQTSWRKNQTLHSNPLSKT